MVWNGIVWNGMSEQEAAEAGFGTSEATR